MGLDIRLKGIDIVRGYALILMVIFHFSFDLNNFHYVNIDIQHSQEWRSFRYLIVTMFVFLAGVSLYLANKNGVDVKKLRKRVLTLSLASLLVSIGSYTQFPNSWIYFGILHFFLFASIVGILFLKVPKLSLILGLSIILGYRYSLINMHWLFTIVQRPLNLPIIYTEDLANIIPWFGVFLLGLSFANTRLLGKIFNNVFFNSPHKFNRAFSFLGKHSLLIYLLHQPIFFGLFLLIKYFS